MMNTSKEMQRQTATIDQICWVKDQLRVLVDISHVIMEYSAHKYRYMRQESLNGLINGCAKEIIYILNLDEANDN